MRARLTIEKGDGQPRVCELDAQPVTLGRSKSNDLVLADEHASRHHARLLLEQDEWVVYDQDTLNGTYVNGQKIARPTPLEHGDVIGIADMRLRFALAEAASLAGGDADSATLGKQSATALWADELAGLHQFMMATIGENDPHAVVEETLEVIRRHTGACLAGFLSQDPDNPISKMTLPSTGRVDTALSRHLTQCVVATGTTAWLQQQQQAAAEHESLAFCRDAICVPLRTEEGPLGAVHVYSEKRPFTPREVHFCEVVATFAANTLAKLRRQRSLVAENVRLKRHLPLSTELIGASAALAQLRAQIAKAAASDATVLIHGETGAGKELVAQALHAQSPRKHGPLVTANCGALPENLIESELFGHSKGAFTGAVANHPGFFQQADDGTLFLDEIGDLPTDAQIKLLRVLEGHPFRPVGGTSDIRTDVRVLAATHQDLDALVAAGKFRRDLYFRLRVLYIKVPALREHAEDIPALVEHFLAQLSPSSRGKGIAPAALRRLQEYSWPGNVRQLRSVLENALVMSDGPLIEPKDLWLSDLPAADLPPSWHIDDIEAWLVGKVLDQTKGNITRAADIIGWSRDTLTKKIHHIRTRGAKGAP